MASPPKNPRTVLLSIRVDPAWLDVIRERCQSEGIEPRPKGRIGGVGEWARRVIARELGLEMPGDPHEEAREQLAGKPNLHHPTRFGRATGRQATKLRREGR